MHTRRPVIKHVCVLLCWVAALSTVGWDIPGAKTENLIFAIAITVTLWWRSEPGPAMKDNIRHIGRILYMRGLHDGMRRGGGQGAGTKVPAPKPPPAAKVRSRRWHWALRLALPAMVAASLAVALEESDAVPFVSPMRPGVYNVQPEGAVEQMRTGPTREATAPAQPERQRAVSPGRTSTGATVSPRAEDPAPTPAPLETTGPRRPRVTKPVKQRVKTVRSKAPRPVLSSLLDP